MFICISQEKSRDNSDMLGEDLGGGSWISRTRQCIYNIDGGSIGKHHYHMLQPRATACLPSQRFSRFPAGGISQEFKPLNCVFCALGYFHTYVSLQVYCQLSHLGCIISPLSPQHRDSYTLHWSYNLLISRRVCTS
jgi:hypothetical protein